ncbi:lipase maturation factor family protein [Gryllotalpicola ginsengisoli]|uniref:lipase maturation factor family protein n=1 Tax=Gryllotalpicola ginsengisoli TaxID=444608 RepID=UPI0003B64710|nr:lipase maturation factor family protein [Gryllotalpicola ginsengisoli]
MDWLGSSDYVFAREVLQRGVAAVYLIAFISAIDQFPALLGERGLLPVTRFLRFSYARRQPTIFRWRYSDRLLIGICTGGGVVAAALVAGLPQLTAPWLTTVLFLLIWGAYLSIVNVGQTFYGFGWESLLCEAGFTVAWLGSATTSVPWTAIFLTRWLVFRLEFGAGMIKMRGGREWRDLTALYYHHETQPMPGPFSRQAHLLPKWFHRFEVLGNHFAQLVVPFFLFAPQPVASIAAAIVILTQLWLIVTGNFAWLNWITVILAASAISDPVVHAVIPAWPAHGTDAGMPIWYAVPVLAASVLLVYLSWWPARNLLARNQLMNASFNRWHLVNAYGAFGTVTKTRFEIVIEGTDDPAGGSWKEYEFHGKPGDPARVPRWFAPYHLRLDWLMWFLALGAPGDWFDVLLARLLAADRRVLRLLRIDPFAGRAPAAVRARVYRYRFATRAEKRATGLVWIREDRGLYAPARRARVR